MLMVRRVMAFLLFFMIFLVLRIDIAVAEPLQVCRNLAKQFAEIPEKLSDSGLAELRKCITDELRIRFAGEERAVPQPRIAPPMPSPPPPPPKPRR
jgi:hypothetical protein